ncbi:MAG TPA: HU family DNA-binding protein [Gaiellaceae bacterium]|nr:HU family DNA-binding protein [Gaiellaceae bacterium]
MTKQEFVDAVAQKSGLNRREAAQAVDAVLETIQEALKRRDQINFTGFGKFATSERKARMGVNPRNPGEKVQIPAATVPKFTAGSALKQAVRG